MRHFFGDLRADLLHKNQVVRPFAPAVESLYHALFADTLICDQTHCGVLKKGLGGLVMAGEPKCGHWWILGIFPKVGSYTGCPNRR